MATVSLAESAAAKATFERHGYPGVARFMTVLEALEGGEEGSADINLSERAKPIYLRIQEHLRRMAGLPGSSALACLASLAQNHTPGADLATFNRLCEASADTLATAAETRTTH
jgi:hypothetical protein